MNRKTPWAPLASILIAILYGASPIDLIPDLVPLLGLVDDALIVPLFLVLATVQFRRNRQVPAKARIQNPPR